MAAPMTTTITWSSGTRMTTSGTGPVAATSRTSHGGLSLSTAIAHGAVTTDAMELFGPNDDLGPKINWIEEPPPTSTRQVLTNWLEEPQLIMSCLQTNRSEEPRHYLRTICTEKPLRTNIFYAARCTENPQHIGTRPIITIQLEEPHVIMIFLWTLWTEEPHPASIRLTLPIVIMLCLQIIWTEEPHPTSTRPILMMQSQGPHVIMLHLLAIRT